MTELLTAAQMRAIEQAAIASGKVTGLELMERAGAGVVEAVFEEWPELGAGAHRAVVLCGPGNNGGDGFVVARLLKERGWEVEVFLYGDPERLPPDAKANFERWGKLGGRCRNDLAAIAGLKSPKIVVDAVFGTGLRRPMNKEISDILDVRSRMKWPGWVTTRWVAVDCPSGLDCDSGNATAFVTSSEPCAEGQLLIHAQCTVTFHSPKLGHYLKDGPFVGGKLKAVDIGIWDWDRDSVMPGLLPSSSRARLSDFAFRGKPLEGWSLWADLARKYVQDHKYDHGHALILTGGFGKTGAARLAARGALRIGAGLVTLGVPGAAQMEVASQITALMLRRVEDAEGLAEVLEDGRINALCLGPGLGLERARALVAEAVRAKHAPYVVLDADALTAFADAPAALFDLLHDRCVLTPHGGEFARLFPDIARRLREEPRSGPAYSKVDATRDAAKRAGCTVLFKGPDTVIADPEGRCSVNAAVYDRAAPWLATAGSGDVLAGFITGLLARGFAPMEAAETAAWLHVECARSFGPGLIAEDLPEELPKVFRALAL